MWIRYFQKASKQDYKIFLLLVRYAWLFFYCNLSLQIQIFDYFYIFLLELYFINPVMCSFTCRWTEPKLRSQPNVLTESKWLTYERFTATLYAYRVLIDYIFQSFSTGITGSTLVCLCKQIIVGGITDCVRFAISVILIF